MTLSGSMCAPLREPRSSFFGHVLEHARLKIPRCPVAIAINVVGCTKSTAQAGKRITPEYDQATGKLKLLKYDSNGNGVVDTWSYMDGPRVVRIEIDTDEDGRID